MRALLWRLTRGRAATAFYRAARDNRDIYGLRQAHLARSVAEMRNYLARPDTMIPVHQHYRSDDPTLNYLLHSMNVAMRRPRARLRWPAEQWVRT